MIVINPGSGPVDDATEANAIENMKTLATDCELRDWTRKSKGDDEGRYCFAVVDKHGRQREVDMPGLPLAKVRFLGTKDQNIWHFPRLYIDGSSWVWKYAVSQLSEAPEVESPSESEVRK